MNPGNALKTTLFVLGMIFLLAGPLAVLLDLISGGPEERAQQRAFVRAEKAQEKAEFFQKVEEETAWQSTKRRAAMLGRWMDHADHATRPKEPRP